MYLEIKGVGREFQRGQTAFWAVKDIDLTADAGEFLAITGRSGSGKSTLLNLIAGLLNPTAGEILLDGKRISGLTDQEASFLRNRQIGYVMQGDSTLGNLTVLDNVRLPYYLFPNEAEGDPGERAASLLEKTGIFPLKDSYPSELSGGELKRVAIARALMNRPGILLADEPTGDLDTENTRGIMELFRLLADQGTTVIVVTHEMENLRYADRAFRMEDGILHEALDFSKEL